MDDPLETRSYPTCYCNKFCHSRSNYGKVCWNIGREFQKFGDARASPPLPSFTLHQKSRSLHEYVHAYIGTIYLSDTFPQACQFS